MSDDAIPAATLVVWRDTDRGPEILVVDRSAGMAFAAWAIVFPGGRIDPADRAQAEALGRLDDAAKVTAVRETIEETGVVAGIRGPIDPVLGLQLQSALHDGADAPGFCEPKSRSGFELYGHSNRGGVFHHQRQSDRERRRVERC